MSKMADIALQLDERAVELGFADHLEALGNGYEWGIKDNGEAFLFKPKEEQEKAHEAWLKERDEVVAGLNSLIEVEEFRKKMLGDDYLDTGEIEIMTRAVRFIKEQCHD